MDSSDDEVEYQCNVCGESRVSSEIVNFSCTHEVCLICLDVHVHDNLRANIRCPVEGCISFLTDFDVRKVLRNTDTSKYEQYLLANLPQTFTCLLPECGFIVEYEDPNTQFECPNCRIYNCVFCCYTHRSMTCDDVYNKPDAFAIVCQEEMEYASKCFATTLAERRRNELISASNSDIITNDSVFECFLCYRLIGKGLGVTLRQCLHNICRDCLKNHIKNSEKFPIRCPDDDCEIVIEDREITKMLNEKEYRLYENKSFNRLKPKLENYFKCKSADCEYFCELQNKNEKEMVCPSCSAINCCKCDAIHPDESCSEYQKRVSNSQLGETAKYIEEQIKLGQYIKCFDCKTLIQKISGCNWIQCTNCGLEICWVRKMPRWGPKGRGDTSGGCKCGVDGPCYPGCTGCIPHI